jgi:sporulation protein YlmC with PRC-barrel domain
MKRIYILLSTMAIFGVFLAACSPTQPTISLSTPQPTEVATQSAGSLPNTGAENTATTPDVNNQQPTQPAYPSSQAAQTTTSNQASSPAQDTQGATSSSNTSSQFDPGHLSNLLQLNLLDLNNQQIGTIRDMVLNLSNLQVEYVIVIVKQPAGTPSQETAVPWNILKLQTASSQNEQGGNSQNVFIFEGTQQKLAGAPPFHPNMLPQIGQPAKNWDAAFRNYWGLSQAGTIKSNGTTGTPSVPSVTQTPGQQTTATGFQGVVLASQVLAYRVDGSNNQQIANVNDIILDPTNGNLEYVLINVTGLQGLTNQTLVPVPLRALSWNSQYNTININVPPQVLLNAPRFSPGQLPKTTNPNWNSEIQTFWQQYIQPQP